MSRVVDRFCGQAEALGGKLATRSAPMTLPPRLNRIRHAGLAFAVSLSSMTGGWASPQAATPDTSTTVSAVRAMAVIEAPDWISRPTEAQMQAFLARHVPPSGGTGKVVLKCKVLPTTDVSDCSVLAESNPAIKLGAAALEASPLFKIKPRSINGKPLDDAWVLIPLSFHVKPTDPPQSLTPFANFHH